MGMLKYLQETPAVTREDVNVALDTMIKAHRAYTDARTRWADYHPVCVALAAEHAAAQWEHQRLSTLYYGQTRRQS
jgi:hypothetical protein